MNATSFSLNNPEFWAIIERFGMNLFFLFLLLRVVYYRYSRKTDYLFGYFLMGIVIFFIGAMLRIVSMQFQMAIGLFAIFTILNLRTISFDVKNMSYLFAVIAISAINSLDFQGEFPFLGILIFNLIIIASAFTLEYLLEKKDKYKSHPITFNDMEMLKPERKQELIDNVAAITGLNVKKVKIISVNYTEKVARLEIYYEP